MCVLICRCVTMAHKYHFALQFFCRWSLFLFFSWNSKCSLMSGACNCEHSVFSFFSLSFLIWFAVIGVIFDCGAMYVTQVCLLFCLFYVCCCCTFSAAFAKFVGKQYEKKTSDKWCIFDNTNPQSAPKKMKRRKKKKRRRN